MSKDVTYARNTKNRCNVTVHDGRTPLIHETLSLLFYHYDITVPVRGIAALHVHKAHVLHAHYAQCPRT